MKKTIALIFTTLFFAGSVWAEESFSFDSFDTEENSSPVEINGHVSASTRYYINEDSINGVADLDDEADEVEIGTEFGLKINYEGSDFAIHSDFIFEPELLGGEISESALIVNEAYGQYFGNLFSIEAGLMKVVWGKADEFHVVDVLNNVNMSEFLVPDYIEMRDPELMFKVNCLFGMSSNLEIVYIPTLTVDKFAESGRWQPKETINFESVLAEKIAQAYTNYGFTLTPNNISKNTNTLDHSQAALHFTSSAGGFDYGFTYYAGYNKMPSLSVNEIPTMATATTGSIDYSLSYDPMHTFGFEAGFILAGFNLKGEFAYNMTYDFDGDDASVHNNSIRWVGGFDRDIPIGNLNINIQEAGNFILNNDEIGFSDIEYNEKDHYTQNLLIIAITDKFFNDKLETKVIGFYHFEDQDFGIYPVIEYSPVDDFTLALEGRFFGGESDTLFGQYKDNSFVELALTWNF